MDVSAATAPTERHLVASQFREDLKAKMDLFGLTAADLGFSSNVAPKGSRKPQEGGKQREMKGGPCKVCQFETSPLHDARKHRSQGDDKRPFTDVELADLGMHRVEHAEA